MWRVEHRATFAALRRGRRGRSGPLTVTYAGGSDVEPPRVAFTVGRRFGGAVARNRVRRRLRAMLREGAPTLAPGAYLVGVAPGADHLPPEELRMHLSRAISTATTAPR